MNNYMRTNRKLGRAEDGSQILPKPDGITPYSLPSDACDKHFIEPDEGLMKEIAELCRVMRVVGKIHRHTPESDATEILAKVQAHYQNYVGETNLHSCGFCGGKMSKNPHPNAGKPSDFLTVGTQYVCIPCVCKTRHNWAERAMKAEGQVEERKNYVELAENQELPEIPQLSELCIRKEGMDAQYLKAQQDMLNDNFRRVKIDGAK